MNQDHIMALGTEYLYEIEPFHGGIVWWKVWLISYQFQSEYPDDPYVWLTCVLALKAVSLGNFGIGCLLINEKGEVVVHGHNQVFTPYFRSDRHAEMVVMNDFEKRYHGTPEVRNFALYTSLEPCPMCLARLIISDVPAIFYAARDYYGGMIQKRDDFPQAFLDLSQGRIFQQALCSPTLIKAADDILSINRLQMRYKIEEHEVV